MGRSIRDSVRLLTVSISDNFSYCVQVVGVSESKRSLKKLVNAIKVFTLICRSPNLNSVQKRDIIKRSNNFVSCSLGCPKYLQTRKMYKRLLALSNKLSTWRSQSDGFPWKIMPSSFNQLFRSIPCTRGGSGLEILPCTTISQVLVRFSFIRFLTTQG